MSDLQERGEQVLISRCGTLNVTFSYSADKERMSVTIHQARDIPTKDRGGANHSQVKEDIVIVMVVWWFTLLNDWSWNSGSSYWS